MNRGYRFYAFRFLSRRNLDRGSRRVRAAIIAIALSLVPFVTVVEVSGGMISVPELPGLGGYISFVFQDRFAVAGI